MVGQDKFGSSNFWFVLLSLQMETAQYWMRKQRKTLKIEDAAIACFRLARRGQDRQEAEADPIYLLQAPGMGRSKNL